MSIRIIVIFFSMFTLYSCEFSKAVSKDFITGITTSGDGLSCDNVYLSDGKDKINRSSFIYGEKVFMNFENIEGFKKEGTSVFPGLRLTIVGNEGDTLMHNEDLYDSSTEGFDISPLLLQTHITVANPIASNHEYKLYVHIWDKKGDGTYKATMDFEVVPDDLIKTESNNVSFDEIYLFAQERNATITNGQAKFNENLYLIFDGLDGFIVEDGKAYLGLSLTCKDAEGKMIMNEVDLIGDSVLEITDVKKQMAPSFIFTNSDIKNPVNCVVTIWDKKSKSSIRASIDLNIE